MKEKVGLDYIKAKNFFEQAANQGNAEAQCVLGIIYNKGSEFDRVLSKLKYGLKKQQIKKI